MHTSHLLHFRHYPTRSDQKKTVIDEADRKTIVPKRSKCNSPISSVKHDSVLNSDNLTLDCYYKTFRSRFALKSLTVSRRIRLAIKAVSYSKPDSNFESWCLTQTSFYHQEPPPWCFCCLMKYFYIFVLFLK